jgi:hypothetical protein
MAYHERDTAEATGALLQRYRDGEFTLDVLRASLLKYMSRADAEQTIRDDYHSRGGPMPAPNIHKMGR